MSSTYTVNNKNTKLKRERTLVDLKYKHQGIPAQGGNDCNGLQSTTSEGLSSIYLAEKGTSGDSSRSLRSTYTFNNKHTKLKIKNATVFDGDLCPHNGIVLANSD